LVSMSAKVGLSPRSGEASPRTPSALRNELAAARKAVEVLKNEKTDAESKMKDLKNVLEKERTALRDVLSAARTKVDELQADVKTKDEEIERLKALLANQKSAEVIHVDDSSHLERETERLKKEVGALEGSLATSNSQHEAMKTKYSELEALLSAARAQASDFESQLAQAQGAVASGRQGNDKETLMKQLASLREQLQSQSKLFSEQMDASRKREEDIRSQMVRQRQDSNVEMAELRKQLALALESENAHKVEQLNKAMARMRKECALRLCNMFLLRFMGINRCRMFHFWLQTTQQNNAEKRLSEEARYKLEKARAKSEGRLTIFGATPLNRKTHMQSRNDNADKQRFEMWENMSPRTGRGDGRDSGRNSTPTSSPKSSPHASPNASPNASPMRTRPTYVQPMGRSLQTAATISVQQNGVPTISVSQLGY